MLGKSLPAVSTSVRRPELKPKTAASEAAPSVKVENHSVFGGRKVRKAILKTAAFGVAAYEAAVALPDSVLLGLDTYAGRSDEAKRVRSAKLSILSHTVAGSTVGAFLGGPVGLVCGGVVGFLSGTMSNHLDGKSGIAERKQQKVSAQVQDSIGQSQGIMGQLKATFAGAAHGVKETFKNRSLTANVQFAGVMDGIDFLHENKSASEEVKSTAKAAESGLVMGLLKKSVGLVCGVSGVMINAPGGLIVGMLESLKEPGQTKAVVPTQLTKTTMLLATNVGKFLPAAAVAAVLGGPVGIAASTAVGIANASLSTIIDGRFGLNQRIASPVAQAVDKAHGGEEYEDGLRAYYRAGKGAAVGLSIGVEQGWKTGYQGGIDIVTDMGDTTSTVAKGS